MLKTLTLKINKDCILSRWNLRPSLCEEECCSRETQYADMQSAGHTFLRRLCSCLYVRVCL